MTSMENLGMSEHAPVAVHPPWRAGQYVTYVLERDDGSWVAFALRIVGQAQDGAWAIEGNFKTLAGECAVVFRADPKAPADAPDVTPVRTQITRTAPPIGGFAARPADDPTTSTALAMNVLGVRRWPAALAALSTAPRTVNYPCGIARTHLLVTPGPGHAQYHDLSPRVMVTGVARLAIDGARAPMTATSFGFRSDDADAPNLYDDFIDLSHLVATEHDGFALTYPATWFLRQAPDESTDGVQRRYYGVHLGGVSCSLVCSVTIDRGAHGRIEAEHTAARARSLRHLPNLALREDAGMQLPAGAWGSAHDYVHPVIAGVGYSAGFRSEDGARFALVDALGCVSKAHPHGRAMLASYDRVFREILENFRFRGAGTL